MFNSNAANQSACGSSSPGRGTRELFVAKELVALMTKRCGNLSETESTLLSYLGNLLPELEQKNRTIFEKDQLIDTIANELEDVRTELDMLKADFQDYREQVARDKAEADENSARTVPLANAAAAKNREDRNGGSQLRFKREVEEAVDEEVVVVAHKKPKRKRSNRLTNSEATSSTPYLQQQQQRHQPQGLFSREAAPSRDMRHFSGNSSKRHNYTRIR